MRTWNWFPKDKLLEKGVRVHTSCSIPFLLTRTQYLTSDSLAFTWAGPDMYMHAHLANSFTPRQTLGFLVRRPIVRDAFFGSCVLTISPFSTPAGAHGGAAAPPEREVEWAAAS